MKAHMKTRLNKEAKAFYGSALRVCVVGDGHKFCTIEMLTLVRVHRFCSNMAHFKDMDTHISDPF